MAELLLKVQYSNLFHSESQRRHHFTLRHRRRRRNCDQSDEHERWSRAVSESHRSSSVGPVVLERAVLIERLPALIKDRSSQGIGRVCSVITTTTKTNEKQQRAAGIQEEKLGLADH